VKKILLILSLSVVLILASCSKFNENIKNILTSTHSEENTEQESSVSQESKQEDTSHTIDESESSECSEDQDENISSDDANPYDLKIGDKISVKNSFPVYRNSDNARDDNLQSSTYEQGIYYVYKKTNDAINLSRVSDKPGGWTTYNYLKGYELLDEGVNSEQRQEPKQKPANTPDEKKSLSWSWLYPDQSSYMKEYSAIYKLDVDEDIIYLTFDNGYEYKNLTSQILDILKANNVKAAFFTTSSYISDNPDLAKRMIDEGHNLSNHTAKHLSQGQSSSNEIKEDILGWEDTYKKVLGLQPDTSLMRPPAGSYSVESLKIAHELGYKTTFWNYAYVDWDVNNQPDPEDSLKKLLDSNEPGSILLLHAVSQTNVDILDRYIKSTISQGYRFELLK
jgi:peptidoglycan-N-acetylmuramic acid deacetylase